MGRYIAAALCAVAVTGASFAQDEKQPPGGGRGGRGGAGGGRGGFAMFGGASSSYIRDLEMPQVQEDLKLTADEKGNIPLLKEELAEGDKKFGESLQGVAREEMMAKMGERRAEVEKQIKEVLGDKYTRFHQIRLQLDGMFAGVTRDKEVEEKLNITQDQKTQLQEAMRPPEGGGRGAGGGGFRAFNPGDGPPSPEKMKELMEEGQKRMEEMQKRQAEAVEKILTADQKAKWEELIGTKVTYKRPPMQFGQGGRGFGGGAGGGRGGRRGGAKGDAPPTEEPAKKPPMVRA